MALILIDLPFPHYKRLGLLPDGTLGREYWKPMTGVGFSFPGERLGIPDSVAYHDVLHVLAGNQTTPYGEIQQGAFTGHFHPDLVLWAIHRGAMCHVDMTHQWSFRPPMALPIDEARAHVGLMPKLSAGPALRVAA